MLSFYILEYSNYCQRLGFWLASFTSFGEGNCLSNARHVRIFARSWQDFGRRNGFVEQPPLVDERGIQTLRDWHYMATSLSRVSKLIKDPLEAIERFIDDMYFPKVIVLDTRLNLLGEQTILESYFLSQFDDLDFLRGIRPAGSLSVLDSIDCLRDKVRTRKFLLGIREAVEKLENENEGWINTLDAGCGAIPIMAIYAVLCSKKVRCTALELNPESADFARRLIEKLDLQDRIQIVEADAIKFKPEEPVDLLISETMNSCLTEEPIVLIMDNLSRFVRAGGVILPSKIAISSLLVPFQKSNSGRIGEDVWESYDKHEKRWQPALEYRPGDMLEKISVEIPISDVRPGDYVVVLTCTVSIGSMVLGPVESIITMPILVRDWSSNPHVFTVRACQDDLIVIGYRPSQNLDGKGRFSKETTIEQH